MCGSHDLALSSPVTSVIGLEFAFISSSRLFRFQPKKSTLSGKRLLQHNPLESGRWVSRLACPQGANYKWIRWFALYANRPIR